MIGSEKSGNGEAGGRNGAPEEAVASKSRAKRRIPNFAGRIARRIVLARLVLFWELAWPALWPAVGSAGLFIALSLAGAWQIVEGWYHLAALVAFASATLTLLWRGLRTLRTPDVEDGRRRLEHDSGLDHRPLVALSDQLATGRRDPETRALWRAYRLKALRSLKSLRVRWPQTRLAAHDPLGIRAAIILALFIGVMASGVDAPARMLAAFKPDLIGAVPPVELEAWITPPEYTGRAPVLLSAAKKAGTLSEMPNWAAVPAGSTLFARVHGGRGKPTLSHDNKVSDFEAIDQRNHQISQALSDGGTVAILQDKVTVASWKIEVTPDQAPVAAFTDLPAPSSRLSLKISYLATDDYGVTALRLKIEGPGGNPESIALAVPRQSSTEIRNSTFRNFTPHRWAGLSVKMSLEAEDAIGNTGKSDTIDVVLPERKFEHPVAKAIIEQRKRLARDATSGAVVSRALRIIGSFPEEFDNDVVVSLSLRSASSRLILAPGEEGLSEVVDLLWDTALRVEDGVLSIAEANLRNAEQALMDALERGAEDEEIDRLTDQLQQAMERFLQALAEDAMRNPDANAENMPVDPNSRMLRSEDLQKLLDRARELSRMGAKDAARELLSQLREMLENLKAGRRTARMSPQMREGQKALKGLSELMRRQQELLDRTFRESRRQPGQRGKGQSENPPTAGQQEALRRALGEIMRQLGEGRGSIPKPLGKAERAMRGAGQSLEQGRPGDAVPSQSQALEQLRAGVESLARSMMAERGRGGTMTRRQPRPGQNRTDPLGRPMGDLGTDEGTDVKVPTEAAMQRARKIMEELHRRSADPARPPLERFYIDRLLRRF